MSNWISRDTKLHRRNIEKTFSKPFKKTQEKNKRDQQRRIREAQQAKNSSFYEDDDVSNE